MAPAPFPGSYMDGVGYLNPDLDLKGPRHVNGVNGGAGKATLSFVVRARGRRHLRSHRIADATERPLIQGQFKSVNGTPIAGARIWRAAAATPGKWQIFGKALTTSKKGRVAGRLPAGQPSRHVTLVYFPLSDSNANVQSPQRRLDVRARSTLRLNRRFYRNGQTIRFSGRVTTTPVKPEKIVLIQARLRGEWQPFKYAHAGRHGRWSVSRRFGATPKRTAYRFRALVVSEAGYGYATGHSRVVKAIVAP